MVVLSGWLLFELAKSIYPCFTIFGFGTNSEFLELSWSISTNWLVRLLDLDLDWGRKPLPLPSETESLESFSFSKSKYLSETGSGTLFVGIFFSQEWFKVKMLNFGDEIGKLFVRKQFLFSSDPRNDRFSSLGIVFRISILGLLSLALYFFQSWFLAKPINYLWDYDFYYLLKNFLRYRWNFCLLKG